MATAEPRSGRAEVHAARIRDELTACGQPVSDYIITSMCRGASERSRVQSTRRSGGGSSGFPNDRFSATS